MIISKLDCDKSGLFDEIMRMYILLDEGSRFFWRNEYEIYLTSTKIIFHIISRNTPIGLFFYSDLMLY